MSVLPAFRLAQKALWHSSNLRFLLCFIFDNPLPVRILAGSYNGMYFQGSHFHDRKVDFSFLVGVGTMRMSGLTFFLSFGLHSGKNQLRPEIVPVVKSRMRNNYNTCCPISCGQKRSLVSSSPSLALLYLRYLPFITTNLLSMFLHSCQVLSEYQ